MVEIVEQYVKVRLIAIIGAIKITLDTLALFCPDISFSRITDLKTLPCYQTKLFAPRSIEIRV